MSEDFPALSGFRAGSLVAGYRLEAEAGAGGMAVVFRARDQRLNRVVALKILAPGLAADEGFRRRFIAESQAAAAVDDPHIIPVYEAGETSGVLFIAMRFVAGGDLRGVLAREGPLPPGRAAGFISPVAAALDAAHRAGLVHRDVKPANILVDAHQDRPDHVYLSDFGVSKGAMSSASVTGAGQFLGTPEYSAPEQVQGRAVDGRADQYALACVAWQLLTGSAPFERDQGLAVLLAHLSEPPPSLAGRRPDLAGAAGDVLARALAKVPEKRYRSCREFADALREALGLPPYTFLGTTAPGHPRTEISTLHSGSSAPDAPQAADIAGAACLADLASAPTVDSVPHGARAAASGASQPTLRPDTSTADASRPPSAADVLTPHQRIRPSTANNAAGSARRPRRRLPAIMLAGALLATAGIAFLVLATGAPSTSSHSHSYAGAGAAKPSARNSPTTTATGTRTMTLPLPWRLSAIMTDPVGQAVNAVAFAPDGTTLATGDYDGSTYLWNITTRKLTATLTVVSVSPVNRNGVRAVAFGPGGTILASAAGGFNASTWLWETTSRNHTATLTDPASQGVNAVAFAPDGTTLATGDYDGSTYLWNITTGRLAATLTDPSSQGVNAVAFAPDGATVATADGNGSIYLWDAANGKLTATLTTPASRAVNGVTFAPDGISLAASDSNGSTYLWNITTRKLTATFTDPGSASVSAVAFGQDGTTLATGDQNGSTYLWNIPSRKRVTTLADPASQGVNAVAFTPDSTMLAAGDQNGSTYLWRTTR